MDAIPMVTMAQNAVNWRNTHTHMDRTHSLTHLTFQDTGPFVMIALPAGLSAQSFPLTPSCRGQWIRRSL